MIKLRGKISLSNIIRLVLLGTLYAIWCYYYFTQVAHAETVYYNAAQYPGNTYQCTYCGEQGYCYYVKDYGYYDKSSSNTTYSYNYYYGQNVGIAFGKVNGSKD